MTHLLSGDLSLAQYTVSSSSRSAATSLSCMSRISVYGGFMGYQSRAHLRHCRTSEWCYAARKDVSRWRRTVGAMAVEVAFKLVYEYPMPDPGFT